MSTKNYGGDGFLNKNKKTVSRFKNNKRRFTESTEMQDNRVKRINFKNYLRELEEQEFEDEMLDDE